MNLWIIFLTGLTTGGLTCLAVQGGLLATALAQPVTVEKNVHPHKRPTKAKVQPVSTGIMLPKDPLPTLAFLSTKLIAYTILGFLLGLAGSVFQLSSTAQGIIQAVVGVYMLISALNMLNVHPIFRYFVIQPPHSITRLIRNQAKSRELFTPALLGVLTVLIPCGTTQAMMALAVTSGNGLLGATILFVYILGTSPTFFILGTLASRVRGKFQPIFATAVALLIAVLGIASIDSGLNLMGASFSPSRLVQSALKGNNTFAPSGSPVLASSDASGVQVVTIRATGEGYVPNYLSAKSGQPIRLRLVTDQNYSCTNIFIIPRLGLRRYLPNSGEVVVDLPAQQPGNVYFTCGMGMYPGMITIS